MLSHLGGHYPAGVSAGEMAAGDGAHRVAANEQSRCAQKFGWREGCLLDIVEAFGPQRRHWAAL
jgi:hypothetical protein